MSIGQGFHNDSITSAVTLLKLPSAVLQKMTKVHLRCSPLGIPKCSNDSRWIPTVLNWEVPRLSADD